MTRRACPPPLRPAPLVAEARTIAGPVPLDSDVHLYRVTFEDGTVADFLRAGDSATCRHAMLAWHRPGKDHGHDPDVSILGVIDLGVVDTIRPVSPGPCAACLLPVIGLPHYGPDDEEFHPGCCPNPECSPEATP